MGRARRALDGKRGGGAGWPPSFGQGVVSMGRLHERGGALALVLVLGSGLGVQGQQARPGPAPAAGARTVGAAPAYLRPLIPPALDSARSRGTRARNGAPGERYWQNSADYDINVQI